MRNDVVVVVVVAVVVVVVVVVPVQVDETANHREIERSDFLSLQFN